MNSGTTSLGAYSKTMRFTIDSRPDAIPPVIDAIMEVVRTTCPGLIDAHDLALAVQEAIANAIVHGCKNDPTKQVECEIACDSRRGLLIVVRDPGPGFDPDAVPPIDADLFADHGRGIFLIRQIMDDVAFASGGAEIRMRKYLPATPTP